MKKAEADVYREEAEAMRDYLKEYGTFQQQKLATFYLYDMIEIPALAKV